MRFHLLNADSDDAISLCIWYKNTQRKDIYKVCLSTVPTCLVVSAACLSVCLCVGLSVSLSGSLSGGLSVCVELSIYLLGCP